MKTPNFNKAEIRISELAVVNPSLKVLIVPITVSYEPIKSKIKAPEIPGKIMAIMAINPDKINTNNYQEN